MNHYNLKLFEKRNIRNKKLNDTFNFSFEKRNDSFLNNNESKFLKSNSGLCLNIPEVFSKSESNLYRKICKQHFITNKIQRMKYFNDTDTVSIKKSIRREFEDTLDFVNQHKYDRDHNRYWIEDKKLKKNRSKKSLMFNRSLSNIYNIRGDGMNYNQYANTPLNIDSYSSKYRKINIVAKINDSSNNIKFINPDKEFSATNYTHFSHSVNEQKRLLKDNKEQNILDRKFQSFSHLNKGNIVDSSGFLNSTTKNKNTFRLSMFKPTPQNSQLKEVEILKNYNPSTVSNKNTMKNKTIAKHVCPKSVVKLEKYKLKPNKVNHSTIELTNLKNILKFNYEVLNTTKKKVNTLKSIDKLYSTSLDKFDKDCWKMWKNLKDYY